MTHVQFSTANFLFYFAFYLSKKEIILIFILFSCLNVSDLQPQELGLPILFSPPHYPLSNQTSWSSQTGRLTTPPSQQGTLLADRAGSPNHQQGSYLAGRHGGSSQQPGTLLTVRGGPPSHLSQDSLAPNVGGLYSVAGRAAYSQLQLPSTANWGSMKRREESGPLSLHAPASPPSINFDRDSYSAVHNMMCQ
jgi:hypothetical protein